MDRQKIARKALKIQDKYPNESVAQRRLAPGLFSRLRYHLKP